MIDLGKIFSPVASPIIPVTLITHVGIDVQGTLLRAGGILDTELEEMQKFFLDINASSHVMSTEQRWAISALAKTKVDYRLYNVAPKPLFYKILREQGTQAVVIDDNKPDDPHVAIYIHPADKKFREFLRTRAYAQEPIPMLK